MSLSTRLSPRAVARHTATRALRATLEGRSTPSAAFAGRFSAQGKGFGKLESVWGPAALAQGKGAPA